MNRVLLFGVGVVAGLMIGVMTYIAINDSTEIASTDTNAVEGIYFFYLDCCPHCQKVKPFVDELSQYVNITFCDMNDPNDECEHVASVVGLRYVPAIVIFNSNTHDFVMFVGENAIMKVTALIDASSKFRV